MDLVTEYQPECNFGMKSGPPNEDLLRPIIEMLRQRVGIGTATVLLKVKAHRGEPLNEEADDCAHLGRLVEAERK